MISFLRLDRPFHCFSAFANSTTVADLLRLISLPSPIRCVRECSGLVEQLLTVLTTEPIPGILRSDQTPDRYRHHRGTEALLPLY